MKGHVYTPRHTGGKISPNYCYQAVHDTGRGVGFHQCGRRWKVEDESGNRWCSQHDPKTVARKDAEARNAYEAERAADLARDERIANAARKLKIHASCYSDYKGRAANYVVISLADFERLAERDVEKLKERT